MLATHEWLPSEADDRTPVSLLVHGVTGWWRTWWRVGPALADAGWRVVAVDLRGHGLSPRLDGNVTVRDLAADLASTVAAIGRPIDLLVGHSLGGAVAAELAALLRSLSLAWCSRIHRRSRGSATRPGS